MKQSCVLHTVKNNALIVRANHLLAFGFVCVWGESAHFMDNDCFECLSPHREAA